MVNIAKQQMLRCQALLRSLCRCTAPVLIPLLTALPLSQNAVRTAVAQQVALAAQAAQEQPLTKTVVLAGLVIRVSAATLVLAGAALVQEGLPAHVRLAAAAVMLSAVEGAAAVQTAARQAAQVAALSAMVAMAAMVMGAQVEVLGLPEGMPQLQTARQARQAQVEGAAALVALFARDVQAAAVVLVPSTKSGMQRTGPVRAAAQGALPIAG